MDTQDIHRTMANEQKPAGTHGDAFIEKYMKLRIDGYDFYYIGGHYGLLPKESNEFVKITPTFYQLLQ